MGMLIYLRANLLRHRGSMGGITLLMLMVTLALSAVLSQWINSREYIDREMDRLGFGDLTAWVSGVPDIASLRREMEGLGEVEKTTEQAVIFANYELGGSESDSEGQLILYSPESFDYRFFKEDLSSPGESPARIGKGEIYVSPSLVSLFGAETGGEILFVLARDGVTYPFVIGGFFEDPFMGSSMIGMKSFLIGEEDFDRIGELTSRRGINGLARTGAMIHITGSGESPLPAAELNTLLNGRTGLAEYTEFVHSREVMTGFMLILQNIFAGLMLAFVLILLAVTLIVMGHAMGTAIEQETVNMAVLKTAGYTGRSLRRLFILLFSLPAALGSLAGFALSPPLDRAVSSLTLTSTGVLVPAGLPLPYYGAGFLIILMALALFIALRTGQIGRIPPVRAIRENRVSFSGGIPFPQGKSALPLRMALRQLLSGSRHYVSSFAIALLLVFFASLIGRMNAWLGTEGEGLMDAFNPADHDLGVQIFGDIDRGDVEAVISGFSPITEVYELAMESVALNGVDYTANIISEPERLHILEGRTCLGKDEVVLTEFLASDLGLSPGDRVTLSAETGSGEYLITGLYQCANDMGANFALSREGYLAIARDDRRIWCVHYFLEDPAMRIPAMERLEELYRIDIHVHENAWPGLYGIISAMGRLMAFMYLVSAVVILTALTLAGDRILHREQGDLTVLRALGFPLGQLRFSFSLRFLVVAAAGALAGTALSAVLTDPLVDRVMRMSGISGFASRPGLAALLLPGGAVALFFTLSALFLSRKMSRTGLNTLITE